MLINTLYGARSMLSPSSLFTKHGTEGARETFPVHAEAAITHVVELDLLAQAALKGRGVAVGGLP